MGAFGDKFRKARESKELSLDDVSNVIKISPRMLRAIEEENFDQLPGGVFNKGFIRSYAKHLGLDPEDAVNEYLELIRQEQIQAWQPPVAVESGAEAKAATAKKSGSSRGTTKTQSPVEVEEELPELQLPRSEHVRAGKKEFLHRPAPDIPWKIVAVGAVVVILASVLWVRHAHHRSPATSSPAASQPQAPTQITAATGSSAPPNAAAPNPNAGQPAAVAPDATADDEKTEVVVRNFGKPLPKLSGTSSEKSSGALTLTVRASENSWISVTADGQPVTEETLIAPAHTTFHASQNFVVKVGNAAAVTFLWNGQEVPATGGEGEVKTLVFDSNGMRLASPSQPAPAQPTSNQ